MGRRCSRVLMLLAIGSVLECYRPSYTGPYICDPALAGADCPEGWSCLNSLCTAPGSGSPDLGRQGICAGAGTLLAYARGSQVWACAGTFPAGGYAAVCSSAPGVHVCGASPGDDLLLSLLECDALRGFYLAEIHLEIVPEMGTMYSVQCEAPGGMWTRAVLGCGTETGVLRFSGSPCRSLQQALRCPVNGSWSCTAQHGLDDVAYSGGSDAPGGVLCCSGSSQ